MQILIQILMNFIFNDSVSVLQYDSANASENSILQVHLEDAVPDAFEMILNYIYSDRIDPTRKGV